MPNQAVHGSIWKPTLAVTCHSAVSNAVIAYEPLEAHGGDGMNVVYADGHVTFETKTSAQQIKAALDAGQNPPNERDLPPRIAPGRLNPMRSSQNPC